MKIPAKVQLFLWKLPRGILPTGQMLAARIDSLTNLRSCVICSSIETSDHIFWQCKISKAIWRKALDWWGFYLKPVPKDLKEM